MGSLSVGAPGPKRYAGDESLTAASPHPAHGRSVAQFYEELARQCVLAEALGYDSFFVAEHHFHEYGVVPNPAYAWIISAHAAG